MSRKEREPLVSVLITTYNQEEYIAQTLDGVLMQQVRFDYEIVIGEDCSTDGTRAICRNYAARHPHRIVLLENNPNKGLLHNYFDSLLRCRGRYIADCAGDDYWIDPKKLQDQVELLEGDRAISLVHTNWKIYNQQTGKVTDNVRGLQGEFYNTIDEGDEAILSLLNQRQAPLVFLSSSCYRREPILAFYHQHTALFRSRRFYCEDLQLVFAALKVGKLYYLDRETTIYRVDEASVSNTKVERKKYRFELSMLELRLYITTTFGIDQGAMDGYFQLLFGSMFLFALRLNSLQPLYRARTLMQRHQVALSGKNRILYMLLSQKVLFATVQRLYTTLRPLIQQLKKRLQ